LRVGLAAVVIAVAALLTQAPARAQYPARSVRIVVPNQAGGVYDLVGRLLAGELGDRALDGSDPGGRHSRRLTANAPETCRLSHASVADGIPRFEPWQPRQKPAFWLGR